MYGTIWALLPPVVAIVLALITKEVYSSLFIGIVTGALIYTGFSPIATLDTVINDGFINSVAYLHVPDPAGNYGGIDE